MTAQISRRGALAWLGAATLSGCGAMMDRGPQAARGPKLNDTTRALYAGIEDNGFFIPPVPDHVLIRENIRTEVDLMIPEPPGTIIVDPWQRYLYHILSGNRATRYRVAVGNQGREFSGAAIAQHAKIWPSWRPTDNMIREFPAQYARYSGGMAGGPGNPLGARAIYLYRGGRDTMYRIHGTNEVSSIGHATSAGCIRMYNHDAIDLAARFTPGARVVVLSQLQSAEGFGAYVPATTPYSGASFNAAADPTAAAAPEAVAVPVAFSGGYFSHPESW